MKGITEKAGLELLNQLKAKEVLDEKIMRLTIVDNQGSLHVDDEKQDDKVFDYDQHKVFAVDSQTAERTSGVTLDFNEKESRFCFA